MRWLPDDWCETDEMATCSLCLAEVAQLPDDGSSYRVFNWWHVHVQDRDQEALVHGRFSLACVSKKYAGLPLMRVAR